MCDGINWKRKTKRECPQNQEETLENIPRFSLDLPNELFSTLSEGRNAIRHYWTSENTNVNTHLAISDQIEPTCDITLSHIAHAHSILEANHDNL